MSKFLVTGAGGFLGFEITKKLVAQGHEVVGLQRNSYQKLANLGVTQVTGSLIDLDAVMQATEGCEAIFHVAAKAGVWGSYDSYYQTNVVGTENIINACKAKGINKLIYTSSPSVTFDGADELGVDESVGYAKKYLTHYPQTKAIAERLVLSLNSKMIKTVALRPHLIWGPGDNNLVPRVVNRKRAGKLKIIGSGKNLVDHTYVTNAADAHIQAYTELCGQQKCAGKAYFISNGSPVEMGHMLNKILEAAGEESVDKHISPAVAYIAGCVLETIYKILSKTKEPMMTRFVARQLSTSHYYDISAAINDFGYNPTVSFEIGMANLAKDLLRENK